MKDDKGIRYTRLNMSRKKMLRLLCAAVLLFVGASSVLEASLGQSITVKWDANTEPDLTGYKVYYDTLPRSSSHPNYINSVDVGNIITHTIPFLLDGQAYYVAVKAYDTVGNESPYSNEVMEIPGRPGYFRAWRQAINETWKELKEVVFNS